MKKRPKKTGWRLRLARLHWPRWLAPYRRHIYLGLGLAAAVTLGPLAYLYVSYGRIIDARLHGERDRAVPRVFGRPLTLQTGQNLSQAELIARLNDVGYAQRSRVEKPGEFAIDRNAVVLISRGGDQSGKPVKVSFPEPPVLKKKPATPPPVAQRIAILQAGEKSVGRVMARGKQPARPLDPAHAVEHVLRAPS